MVAGAVLVQVAVEGAPEPPIGCVLRRAGPDAVSRAIIVRVTADEALTGNRPDGTVEVVGHDSRWRDQFDSEAQQLQDVLAALTPTIEHIGSTAVPGIPAKPTN